MKLRLFRVQNAIRCPVSNKELKNVLIYECILGCSRCLDCLGYNFRSETYPLLLKVGKQIAESAISPPLSNLSGSFRAWTQSSCAFGQRAASVALRLCSDADAPWLSTRSPPVCAAEPRRRDDRPLWFHFVRMFPPVSPARWVILAALKRYLLLEYCEKRILHIKTKTESFYWSCFDGVRVAFSVRFRSHQWKIWM